MVIMSHGDPHTVQMVLSGAESEGKGVVFVLVMGTHCISSLSSCDIKPQLNKIPAKIWVAWSDYS